MSLPQRIHSIRKKPQRNLRESCSYFRSTKMQLLLATQIVKRLKRELRRAGRREIGGLLMGEHVADELFRVVEISVQRTGGSDAYFIRHPKDHEATLKTFFAKTGNEYTRFNYLGEWHSHPSFEPVPSETDMLTMQSITNDPTVGANFLVLLIAKSAGRKQIAATATVFRKGAMPVRVVLETEGLSAVSLQSNIFRWCDRITSAWKR
jgi:[CysO sulfur-carrier protein]-S-L-cysteine hydrolase